MQERMPHDRFTILSAMDMHVSRLLQQAAAPPRSTAIMQPDSVVQVSSCNKHPSLHCTALQTTAHLRLLLNPQGPSTPCVLGVTADQLPSWAANRSSTPQRSTAFLKTQLSICKCSHACAVQCPHSQSSTLSAQPLGRPSATPGE